MLARTIGAGSVPTQKVPLPRGLRKLAKGASKLGFVEPQLHFSASNADAWARDRLTCQELYDELEILRLGVKHATGYAFDNTHFYFDDGYGRPALQFSVWPHDTSLMV